MLKLTFASGEQLTLDVRSDPKMAKGIIALAVQTQGKIVKASHCEEGQA